MNPQPKSKPVRSKAYRRYVAELPCYNCGLDGPSQAAHADFGKGTGIKSSDLTCYPLCPPCHSRIGTEAIFSKEDRRKFEVQAQQETMAQLRLAAVNDAKLRRLLVGA